MSFFSNNLKFLREKLGKKQSEVTKALGFSTSRLSNYEKGVSEPDMDTLIVISRFFGVAIDDLLNKDLSNDISEESIPNFKKNGVPLVESEAFAGTGNTSFSFGTGNVKEYYTVPEFKRADFMIKITGNSMENRYYNGDIVAAQIVKEKTFVQWGKIYVIATKDQGILIKRIKRGTNNSFISAVSENPAFDPFEISWKEITGIALVLGGIHCE
jgi:phage repressor protein C with HTH and peptisase S24 domain